MKLITEDKLIWSPIVVNSRMNRERNASGINSYEQEFKFKPEEYLASIIKESGQASWLDLCCGHGKALIQTAKYFERTGQQKLTQLRGVDLIDTFDLMDENITCLEFEVASLVNWVPTQTYDLITCVHGLHYVGDKLKVIETGMNALNHSGLFIANLDLNNIVIQNANTPTSLKKAFKQSGIVYNSRRKLLQKTGNAVTKFHLNYLGADDTYGPNYTGQESVTSYYSQ